jgi:hypothetical protein
MAPGPVAQVLVVGYDQEGDALPVQRFQYLGHLLSRSRVEIAGRLVGEQQARLHHDAAADGDPLPFAAGELARQVVGALVDAEFLQDLFHLALAGFRRDPGQHQRQFDVLPCREPRDQVVGLEHEPDLVAPQPGALVLVQRHGVDPVEQVDAVVRSVEQAQHVEQGRLARTRGSHYRQVVSLFDPQVDVVQCVDRAVAQIKGFVDTPDLNHPSVPRRRRQPTQARPATTRSHRPRSARPALR